MDWNLTGSFLERFQAIDERRIHAERVMADRASSDWIHFVDEASSISLRDFAALNEAMQHSASSRTKPLGYANSSFAEQNFRQETIDDFFVKISNTLGCIDVSLAQGLNRDAEPVLQSIRTKHASVDSKLKSFQSLEDLIHLALQRSFDQIKTRSSHGRIDLADWNMLFQLQPESSQQILAVADNRSNSIEEIATFHLKWLTQSKRDATARETKEIHSLLSWWKGFSQIERNLPSSNDEGILSITASSSLSFDPQLRTSIPVEITSATQTDFPLFISSNFDSTTVSLKWNNDPMKQGQNFPIAESGRSGKTIRGNLVVERQSYDKPLQPITLIAQQGNQSCRLVIPIEQKTAAMVAVRFRSDVMLDSSHTSLGDSTPFSTRDSIIDGTAGAMRELETFDQSSLHIPVIANQRTSFDIELTNLSTKKESFTAQILLTQNENKTPPAGVISIDHGKQWIQSLGGVAPIAVSLPLTLEGQTSGNLQFPSADLPAGQPLPPIRRAFLIVHCESSDSAQIVEWTPNVVKPSQYITPLVNFHSNQQALSIELKRDERFAAGIAITKARLSLLSPDGFEVYSNAVLGFDAKADVAKTTLSTHLCRDRKAILVIGIDGWPSNFVYEVDLHESQELLPSTTFALIQVQPSHRDPLVSTQTDRVDTDVVVLLSEASFDPNRDHIRVGIDSNNNRVLDDGALIRLDSAFSVKAYWNGIDSDGNICISSTVTAHQVAIPVQSEWDRRSPAIAVYYHGDQRTYGISEPLIFDKCPPRIEQIRVISDQPLLLGAPAMIDVYVNDQGLSGGGKVEACWSTNGQLRFDDTSPITNGVYRQNDRWSVALPTEKASFRSVRDTCSSHRSCWK